MENINPATESVQPEQKAVAMVTKEVSVPQSLDNFAIALADLVKKIIGAMADGFQPGQDIPVVVQAAIADFGPMASNASGVLEALKDEKFASGLCLAIELEKALS